MPRSTVIVHVAPPAWLPVEPSAVLVPLPAAAASVAVGVAIDVDVASAIGTTADRRPPASSSSVVAFAAATAVGVRHEATVLLMVASSTFVVDAPVARRLLRGISTPLPAVVRPVHGRRYHGSSRAGAIAVTASRGAGAL